MDNKWDMIRKVEQVCEDFGIQSVYRKVIAENWDVCKEIMYDICEALIKRKKQKPEDVQKYILDQIDDGYVFNKMHMHEFSKWNSININCHQYFAKKQEYLMNLKKAEE